MDQLGEIVSPRMWTKGVELEHEYNDKHNFVFFFFFPFSHIHPTRLHSSSSHYFKNNPPIKKKKKKKNISCESL